MSGTRADFYDKRVLSTLRCAGTCLFFLLIPATIWCYQSAASLAKVQRIRAHYINTTCLLQNYTLLKSQSDHCGARTFTTTNCFDEHISLTYPIFNGTRVSTTFTISNTHLRHQPSEIGSSSVCFYHIDHVNSVMFELPSEMPSLVQLYMACALLLLPLSVIVVAWLCIRWSQLKANGFYHFTAKDDYSAKQFFDIKSLNV